MTTVDKNIFYNVDNESLLLVESLPLDLQAAVPLKGNAFSHACVESPEAKYETIYVQTQPRPQTSLLMKMSNR